MRLIDADELRKKLHIQYSDDLGILDHIDAQPTVDRWIPINPDDPDTFPEVGEDGESDYIEISCVNWTVTCIGTYRENKEGGAFYAGDDEESMESAGLIVNAWRHTAPYREEEE